MTEKSCGARFRLLVKDGNSKWEFDLEKKSFTFGRTDKANVAVPLPILSSVHLEFILHEGSKWFVEDKNSSNGTYLKGVKLEALKPYLLESPISLRIGQKTELCFEISDLRAAAGIASPKEASRTKSLQPSNVKEDVHSLLAKTEADRNHKEAYALSQRLESLRSEVAAAESKRSILEKDAEDFERAIEEKASRKQELESLLENLETKLSQLSQLENESKKSIQVLVAETEEYRLQRESSRILFEEMLLKKNQIEDECTEALQSFNELKDNYAQQDTRMREALEKERQAHSELQQLLQQLAEKEEHLSRLQSLANIAQRDVEEKRQSLEALNSQLDALRKAHQREEKELQLLISKNQTLKETQVLLEAQRKTSEGAIDALKTEILLSESKLKRTHSEAFELEDKLMRLKSEFSNSQSATDEIKQDLEKLQLDYNKAKVENDKNLKAFREDLDILAKDEREKLQLELSQAKSKFSEWETAERDALNLELKKRRDELSAWELSEGDRQKLLFKNKVEKQEKDLSERRIKELEAIEELRTHWKREREAKRPLEIKEIVRSAGSLLEAHAAKLNVSVEKQNSLVDAFRSDLEGLVKAVLVSGKAAQVENHLKASLVQSPDETLKAKKERKTWALQASLLGLALLMGAIFPELPRSLWESGTSAFRRDPQSADAFVKRIQEARANRPKFMPQRDRVFRNTYTDNLIYLQDYSEIKNDPEVKKLWTLQLNKFFVHDLELDERIIVTFMAIESPLVKDLTEMALKIQLNTQESDISRMRAYEDMSTPRLIEVVRGRENYDKLRNFEFKFYDEYSTKIVDGAATRIPTQDTAQ